MDAQDLSIRRERVHQRVIGTVSHLNQFALQPVPRRLLVMDGVFTAQSSLMKQFVQVRDLHLRITEEMVFKNSTKFRVQAFCIPAKVHEYKMEINDTTVTSTCSHFHFFIPSIASRAVRSKLQRRDGNISGFDCAKICPFFQDAGGGFAADPVVRTPRGSTRRSSLSQVNAQSLAGYHNAFEFVLGQVRHVDVQEYALWQAFGHHFLYHFACNTWRQRCNPTARWNSSGASSETAIPARRR